MTTETFRRGGRMPSGRMLPRRLRRVAVAVPSGNTTAVVFDHVGDVDPARLNAAIVHAVARARPSLPAVEQCCLVTRATDSRSIGRLEMLGGEFCGNATRSVVRLLTGGDIRTGSIEASGSASSLRFSSVGDRIALEMPVPQGGIVVRDVPDGVLVDLGGIAHLVCLDPERTDPRYVLESLLTENRYGLRTKAAAGVVAFDTAAGRAQFCVRVRGTETLIDETACGSGTSAIGVALAARDSCDQDLSVRQPSGHLLRTRAIYDATTEHVTASSISGDVHVVYDGPLDL